ncbi:hypothetical protein AGMMS50230_11640 [Spirochaetia bacterium]|nr:hypothetical protein AGMMS50230_11640 [Spirochaetia bacterium]
MKTKKTLGLFGGMIALLALLSAAALFTACTGVYTEPSQPTGGGGYGSDYDIGYGGGGGGSTILQPGRYWSDKSIPVYIDLNSNMTFIWCVGSATEAGTWSESGKTLSLKSGGSTLTAVIQDSAQFTYPIVGGQVYKRD